MKKAFTLAEILITLGIIGVVTALTIPNLIANYQKKTTVAKLKETYSILQQAFKLSQEDNGEVESWNANLSGKDFFEQYIKNYVKYQVVYTSSELQSKTKIPYKYLNGVRNSSRTLNHANSTHFVLINGARISINGYNDGGKIIHIDVNGLSGPNTVGKDEFIFFLSSTDGLLPYGYGGVNGETFGRNNYSRAIVTGTSNLACAKGKSGYWCSALIMNDGWQIADDYPW